MIGNRARVVEALRLHEHDLQLRRGMNVHHFVALARLVVRKIYDLFFLGDGFFLLQLRLVVQLVFRILIDSIHQLI